MKNWMVEPVYKTDGSVWEGLAYVKLPNGGKMGALNIEQAKAICREFSNALATERALAREMAEALKDATDFLKPRSAMADLARGSDSHHLCKKLLAALAQWEGRQK